MSCTPPRGTRHQGTEVQADELERHDSRTVRPRIVTAKYPGHLWHPDMTVVTIGSGLRAPRFPFTWTQAWPFCWWLTVVVGFAVFKKKPASADVQRLLVRAIRHSGHAPKHPITDRDKAFCCGASKKWCRRRTRYAMAWCPPTRNVGTSHDDGGRYDVRAHNRRSRFAGGAV